MHVLKGGASDYGSVKGEALREEKGHSKVGTINPELTDQNYSLCQHEAPEQIDEYIKSLGVKRKIRADAVRFVSVIIDYPKDEIMDEEKFFQNAKEGLKEHFNISEEAILYATVHKDEGHPHMHLSFVPLIQKEKTYKDGHTEMQTKLSAFDVITPEALQKLHPFMQSYMASRGFTGTLHHDDGEKRDKEFLEHKLEQIEKDIDEKEQKITVINSYTDLLQRNQSALSERLYNLQSQIEEADEQIKEKNEVIEPLEAKISLLTSQMDNLQAEADKIVSEAKLKAESIVEEAQTEALSQKEKYRSAYENILNSARSKADEIVSGAKTEAQGIINEAQETADAITHAAFSNADLQTVKKENEKLKAENTWLKGVIQTFHDKIEDIYWVHHEEPLFAPLREFLTEFNRTMHNGMDGIKRTVKNISSNLGH